jgi:shikimate kinase
VNSSRDIRNIALIGFMGTGKSSVGRLLAEQLRFEFVDTDDLVETRAGKTITEIFQHDGEAAFRELEKQAVATLAARNKLIIATGGGLGASQPNLDSLKTHALVVCLWTSPEKIWQRVRHQTHRPLLAGPHPLDKIKTLLAEREPFYKQADVIMNTEPRSIKTVALQVAREFHNAQAGRR